MIWSRHTKERTRASLMWSVAIGDHVICHFIGDYYSYIYTRTAHPTFHIITMCMLQTTPCIFIHHGHAQAIASVHACVPGSESSLYISHVLKILEQQSLVCNWDQKTTVHAHMA